ncbi:MAG TPA: WbqC family protein, partial [Pseudodesulfovibrio sp.]|nr:WbqC family protein [Pseudodesulfovibrio sp.]
MVVTIHQPDFIPWLGFFDRWSRSDVYVVLDTVQFIRRGWHHRDRIKTPNGPRWLTVPVAKKGRFEQRIADTLIDESSNWRAKHLSTLRAAYVRTSGFAGLFPEVEAIYGMNHRRLMDHNREFLELIAGRLGITAPIVLASDLGVAGSRSELLAGLVEAVGGDVYLTG